MPQTSEEKILRILQPLVSEIEILKSLIVSKDHVWVPKRILQTLTGLSSDSINTYVYQGKILKRGTLYSYHSYLEYLKIYKTRKNKKQ